MRTVRTVCYYLNMPDVKVYIRTEDLDKWNAIKKKSEWLHNALNGRLKHLEKQLARLETSMVDSIIEPRITKLKLCKHGSIKGECMHKEATRLKCNVI